MSIDDALQCIGTEKATAKTGKDGIVSLGRLFSQPVSDHGDDVSAQRRTACFAPLFHAGDLSSDTEFDITAAQGSQLTVTQPGLHGDKQERTVPATDPRGQVRCGQERCGFRFVEKFD